MKKLFILAATALMAFSCSESKPTISGSIENLSGKVYLGFQEKKMPITQDSVVVENGVFEFNHDGSFSGIVTLTKEGDKSPFTTFMVDKGAKNVVVSGSMNSVRDLKVEGSPVDAAYKAYLAQKKIGKDEQIAFLKANPNSIAAAYVLYRNMAPSATTDQLREYKAMLNPELYTSSYIQTLDKLIETMDRVAVGNKFIDIKLKDVDGKEVSLSSVLAENKVVLLDFWASWCPPCRAENPNVVEAFKKYNKKGFTVYGVSLDFPGKDDLWKKAISDDGLAWTNVSDTKGWDCAPAAEYGVRSIPANFLISADGTIIGKGLKGEALHQKLEELLN